MVGGNSAREQDAGTVGLSAVDGDQPVDWEKMDMRFLVLMAAGLSLAACDTNKDSDASAQEAGAVIDRAVEDAGEKVEEVGQDLERAGDAAEAEAREAGRDAKAAGQEAASDVRDGLDKVDRAADAAGRELKKEE